MEAIDGGLKVFVVLNANISCLEGAGCWSSTTTKDATCDDDGDLCGWSSQSMLEVVLLLLCMAEQLVLKLAEYLEL